MYQDTTLHRTMADDTLMYMHSSAAETPCLLPLPDEAHHQQAQLYRLAHTLHRSLDLDETLHTTLRHVQHLSAAQHICLVLLDMHGMPTHWEARTQEASLNRLHVIDVLQRGMEGEAVRQQHIMHIGDTQLALEPQPHLLPGRSLLIIPLYTESNMVGVLSLSHEQPHVFDAPHNMLLAAASETIALALDHAQRHTQLCHEMTAYEEGRYRLVHDIRSPLTAVSASIEVIRRALQQNPPDEATHSLIQESIQSGMRSLGTVLELADSLLDHRKLQIGEQSLEYKEIAISSLYAQIYDMLRATANNRRLALCYEATPDDLRVPGDMPLLRRLVINLVANALRFTPADGSVTLRAYEVAELESILLVVEDTGPGIAPEERERIFQPFVQAKGQKRGGSGLGLSICREVVLAHRGHIWVEERPGGGSRFCVMLPNQAPAR
jgi:signal transduction histidine kinase